MKHFYKFLAAIFLIVLLGSSLAYTKPAYACSCAMSEGEFDWSLKNYEGSVFTGTVQNVLENNNTNGASERPVTFEIIDNFKNATGKTVTVYTSISSSSCGYNFSTGQQYLVYASNVNGKLSTGLCSGNKPLSQASYEVDHLKAAKHTLVPGIQNKTLVPYILLGMGAIVVVIIILILSLVKSEREKK